MAPRSKKSAALTDKEEENEEPLQAVVFADSFQTNFSPFTVEYPRCLLPLANTPLIEYTLEFLANSGVEEVQIFCINHTARLEEYLASTKWTKSHSPFISLRIIPSQARSIGDAMRDLDKRAELKNDFIMVYGDIISNLPLHEALAQHKKRKAADKNSIMTMVLRETMAGSETRRDETAVFVIDPRNDRCLHYESMHPEQENQRVNIDPEILTENQEIDIRADLVDCAIDICTPEVLALWTDNFDFQTPRQNFLFQVLKDYELNGKKIHTHICNDYYASRVETIRAYNEVSKQVISRWAYPLTPESNLMKGQNYKLGKGFRYREENTKLGRSCEIGPKTVLGTGTSVGEGSYIGNSVIGQRCAIGNNVQIRNAYVWDGTIIKDGAVIDQAIIASDVTIGKNCRVEPGALISYNVQITDGVTVKGTSKICRMKRKNGDSEDLERVDPDPAAVGEGGDGAEFQNDEEEEPAPGLVYTTTLFPVSAESFSDPDSESDADIIPTSQRDRSTASSFISIASGDDEETIKASNRDHDFHKEAVANIVESLQRGDESSNVQLELTSLRMVSEASGHAIRRAIAVAFMRHITALVAEGKTVVQAVKVTIPPHVDLIGRNLHDKKKPQKDDQVDLLLLLQTDLIHRKDGENVLMHVVHELVHLDIIQAEGVEQWWEDDKSVASEDLKRVRAKTRQLVEFLIGGDDDSEEDDDEDEEDSE